jgi:hypothetical protein
MRPDMSVKFLFMNPRAHQLRLVGSALIFGAVLLSFFSPVSELRSELHQRFYHTGAGPGANAMPYEAIFVLQCFGPWLLLMVIAFIAGCILLIFGMPLSKELARMPEMPAGEKARLLNAVTITVALYALALAISGATIEYGYVQLDSYPGFHPLLRYATYVGVITLILFPLAKGAKSRWLVLLSGAALLFWAL